MMVFRSIAAAAAAVLIASALVAASSAGSPRPAQPPKNFPSGCVGCHMKMPEGDHRLNALLSKVKGHPTVAGIKNVPGDCMKCHRVAVKKATFGDSMHRAHFAKGAQSRFNKMFGGDCTHCHALAASTGKMSLKSGAKNW